MLRKIGSTRCTVSKSSVSEQCKLADRKSGHFDGDYVRRAEISNQYAANKFRSSIFLGITRDMKNYFRPLIIAVAMTAALNGAAQTAAPSKSASADADWLNLTDLVGPVSSSLVVKGLSLTANSVQQQADQFEAASKLAQAFYQAHPADILAPAAEKLEVVMALQSVQLGDAQNKTSALALATSYLANPLNSPHDRFDIALAVAPLSTGLQGVRLIDDAATYAELGDTLHTQFGDIPEVYAFYLGMMRTVGATGAAAIAQKVQVMAGAPPWIQAKAQDILDRSNLVGQPLDLSVTATDGTVVDLREPSGVPTLLYVWSNSAGTADLDALARFKSSIPAETRVIYLSLQSDMSSTQVAESKAPLPGIFCFEKAGFDGLAARALKVPLTPCVYVTTKDGILSGFGRVADIAALLPQPTH